MKARGLMLYEACIRDGDFTFESPTPGRDCPASRLAPNGLMASLFACPTMPYAQPS